MFKISKTERTPIVGLTTVGMMVGLLGPMLNSAKGDLGISPEQIGQLLSVYFGTSIIGLIAGFFLADKWGKHPFILSGSVILIAGYLLGFFLPSLGGIWISIVLCGIGLGIYQVGINALAVDSMQNLALEQKATRLSFIQFFFGIGAMIAPQLVTWSIHLFSTWNWIFLWVVIFFLLPLTTLLLLELKTGVFAENHKSADHQKAISTPLQFTPVLALILLLAAVYASLETSTFNWIPYYWENICESNSWVSSAHIVSAFWLIFSLSRVTMGKVIEKLGASRSLSFGALLIALLTGGWMLVDNQPFLVALSILLIAMIMGCMVPTLMVVINHEFPGKSAAITSLILGFMTVGASTFPLLLGKIIDYKGATVLPEFLCVLAVSSFILIRLTFSAISRRPVSTK